MLETLLYTMAKRPYVVAFLITYLVIAWRLKGPAFTFVFLFAGYAIAFLSEVSSINNGFPYGWYFYKYENLVGEWLFYGVPVWDSVSYVFMNFAGLCAGYQMAQSRGWMLPQKRVLWWVFSALFVTLLDVTIDPISHLGAQWFLGEIYYYPNPGWYFDIPFANFAGWFLVALCINGVAIFGLKFHERLKAPQINIPLALGLYYGIFGFGVVIAAYLQQWLLLAADVFWIGLTAILIFKRRKQVQ